MTPLLPLLATAWVWMSPEAYVKQSDLIAILRVGTVHEEKTPENILVRSAFAYPEQIIYYRFTSDRKLPEKIVIYQVDPNGHLPEGSAFGEPKLSEGRCFAMLKQQGEDRFIPYERLSLQPLAKEGLFWLSPNGKMEQIAVEQIIEQLKKLLHE
jgi:hypothetical protein